MMAVSCEPLAYRSALPRKLFSLVREEMMISRTWSRKPIAFGIAIAMLSVYSMVALATPGQKAPSGALSVSGQVTVNGQAAIAGTTVLTDSVVATGANSGATITVAKLGRLELLPNTSVKVSFSEGNLSGWLDAGRLQVATQAGTSSIVTTKYGAALSNAREGAMYMVDVECGNMIVHSQGGLVDIRADGKIKPVAAGKSESAGEPQAGTKCTRLTQPTVFGHLSGGALAALLLAAGGAVLAAILATTRGETQNLGGSVTVVSPTR